MTRSTKIAAIALSAALCFAADVSHAQSVSCNVTLLTEKWLNKHTHIQTIHNAYPEAIRRLTVEGVDSDYTASQFGGEQAKKEFKDLIVSSSVALTIAIRRAALSVQNPCYACALLPIYNAATTVANKCVALIIAVNDKIKGEGSSFNCEKVKDFTREDMEEPTLNLDYWTDATRYQKNLEEDLRGDDIALILDDINKLGKHLKKFVDFHTAHPGDAEKLKRDIQAVTPSCGSGVALRRAE